MLGGYMNKLLFVDLTAKKIEVRETDQEVCRAFIGGYGYGSRLLLDKMKPGIDPLGPENILGIMTGPLTGTGAITGSRFAAVGKSPLTGTWGDANCGGYFGPALKFSGYDGIFLKGTSEKPVYMLIDDGEYFLKDATALWGTDCYYTEKYLRDLYGKESQVICIGPAGEKKVLFASIMSYYGKALARSGLGAVMGSKMLKAVVVKGKSNVKVADPELMEQLRKKYIKEIRDGVGFANQYTSVGTLEYIELGIRAGDSPTKNWGGSGPVDIKNPENLSYEKIIKHRTKRNTCWHCPIACWGNVSINEDGYYVEEAHQPEYETGAALGSNCGNTNLASIIRANDLCNRLGLDTISTGSVIAFAMECYENEIINKSDTDNLELNWGNHLSMVKLIEKIAFREGIGDILSLGVMRASEKIGKNSKEFAMHVGGQEIPMHDARYEPSLGSIYQMDATPGRHTQAGEYWAPEGLPVEVPRWGQERNRIEGRAKAQKILTFMVHCLNSGGLCLFGYYSTRYTMMQDFLTAATGEKWDYERIILTGERIAVTRHLFNLREGINNLNFFHAPRTLGVPPLAYGPTKNYSVPINKLINE